MPTTFIDPRNDPDPRAPRAPARFTTKAAELEELHRFCLNGRLYDVERWIQAGRPMQLAAVKQSSRFRTALGIALERQDYSLVLLLVANGYDMNAEPESPLDQALQLRRRDLLDLLLDWGADPRQVDLDALCATYDSQLYERFRRLGVDFTSGHALAYALGYHTSNKPLFGFAKRHRLQDSKIQTELDIALTHHAWEGNEKGVMLCLWAGANPGLASQARSAVGKGATLFLVTPDGGPRPPRRPFAPSATPPHRRAVVAVEHGISGARWYLFGIYDLAQLGRRSL